MSGDDDRDHDRENDPMAPEAWYGEPNVCGSCIAWRPEQPQEGDEVATGACRLRPELGRVPASLKLCDLYKARGQFVYTPKPDAGTTRRKRTGAATVLRRTESGEMRPAEPARRPVSGPREVGPPPEAPRIYVHKPTPADEVYEPPREIDVGEDANVPAIRATFRDLIREELGLSRREMAKKFKGGVVKVAIKEGPYLEFPTDVLFAIIDRLQSSLGRLESIVEKEPELKSEAGNVRKIRGSFTTFNVMWADREDYFSGKG